MLLDSMTKNLAPIRFLMEEMVLVDLGEPVYVLRCIVLIDLECRVRVTKQVGGGHCPREEDVVRTCCSKPGAVHSLWGNNGNFLAKSRTFSANGDRFSSK